MRVSLRSFLPAAVFGAVLSLFFVGAASDSRAEDAMGRERQEPSFPIETVCGLKQRMYVGDGSPTTRVLDFILTSSGEQVQLVGAGSNNREAARRMALISEMRTGVRYCVTGPSVDLADGTHEIWPDAFRVEGDETAPPPVSDEVCGLFGRTFSDGQLPVVVDFLIGDDRVTYRLIGGGRDSRTAERRYRLIQGLEVGRRYCIRGEVYDARSGAIDLFPDFARLDD